MYEHVTIIIVYLLIPGIAADQNTNRPKVFRYIFVARHYRMFLCEKAFFFRGLFSVATDMKYKNYMFGIHAIQRKYSFQFRFQLWAVVSPVILYK